MATEDRALKEERWGKICGMQPKEHTFENVMKLYETWAQTYDDDLLTVGYQGHTLVAHYLAKQNPRKDAKILDVAAGTGLCAKELQEKYGFTNIDALDASYHMLEQAQMANVYNRLFWAKIGDGNKAPFLDDTYDHITISGAISKGGLPVDAFLDLIRITKPGGYIVISTREDYLRKLPECHQFEAMFQKYIENGYWEKMEEITTPYFYMDFDAITWVFRVTKTKSMAMERNLFLDIKTE